MWSNVNRVTGIFSGMDTESMVRSIMKAESMKMNRLKQRKTLLEWKQQAYRDTAKALSDFKSSQLNLLSANSIIRSSTFNTLKGSVTKNGVASTAISVNTSNSKDVADIKLKVAQIAQRDAYVGVSQNATFKAQNAHLITKNNPIAIGSSFSIELDGGAAVAFTWDAIDSTKYAAAWDAAFNGNAAVVAFNASYDAHLAVLEANTSAVALLHATEHTKLYDAKYAELEALNPGDPANITDATDYADANVDDEVTARLNEQAIDLAEAELGVVVADVIANATADAKIAGESEIINIINTKLAARFGSTDGVQRVKVGIDVDGKFYFEASKGHSVKVNQGGAFNDLLSGLGFTAGGTTTVTNSVSDIFAPGATSATFTINGETITVQKVIDGRVATMADIMKAINDADVGIKISYDSTYSAYKIESAFNGKAGEINFSTIDSDIKKLFGFENAAGTATLTQISKAQDAEIYINGSTVPVYRTDNTFEIDGVAITITAAAVGETFDIKVAHDSTQAINSVKNFITEYNNLLDYLHKLTTTPRPTSGKYSYYEPLTDDEKKAMSDREIEIWEKEAKTGLLNRDQIIRSIHSQMRTMMYEKVTFEREDGSIGEIGLFQIGITTTGNIGKLELDEAKFAAVLEKDPEAVIALFTKSEGIIPVDVKDRNNAWMKNQGLATRLDGIIRNAVDFGGSIRNHAGLEDTASIANNTIYRQINQYDTKISSMLTYLARRENYYYQLFSRMENAMQKSNSQIESLYAMIS